MRLNVGHKRDDSVVSKSYLPDTDFECWGWMSKKGGVRRNWLERFFHLDASGMLRYYQNCNTVGVKKGGSTKMRLVGYDDKGCIDLKDCSEIRLSTAPKKTVGEIELVTAERTFREKPPPFKCISLGVHIMDVECGVLAGLRVGRTAGGTMKIDDELTAARVWVACLNMALVSVLDCDLETSGRSISTAVQHVKQSMQSAPS